MKVTVTHKTESVIYNGIIYRNGESFDVEDVIGKSLMDRGYVSSTAPVEEAEMQTGYLDENQVNGLSYPDLKRLAAQMGLDATGKKEELVARICAEEVGIEDDAAVEAEEDEAADDLPNTDMPE